MKSLVKQSLKLTFNDICPSPGGGAKKDCAVSHPIYVSNSHTKIGWSWSNGLGGDRVKDGDDCNIPIAFLKKRGNKHLKGLYSVEWEFRMYKSHFTVCSCLLLIHVV